MSDDIVTRLRRRELGDYSVLLCEEAADEIERLRRNTGCARNQHTTQFCAEALDAQREIERLRTQLEMWQDGNIMAESHRDELVRNADEFRETITELRQRVGTLKAERDEARREVCDMEGETAGGALLEARKRGWDCFKDKAACCSTPADGKHTSAGETKVCGLCDQPSDAVNGHGDCMNCARDQYGA